MRKNNYSSLKKKFLIDINCDMGEGFPYDETLMPYINSANIACGFHAGNLKTIRKTLALAKKYQVNVGAHISFYDREHFGRIEMPWEPDYLEWEIVTQLQLLDAEAKKIGLHLHHVKPHGALYNMAAKDFNLAQIIAKTIFDFDKELILYGLSGSESFKAAKAIGLNFKNEVFADRRYQEDRSLVPRKNANALIEDVEEAKKQIFSLFYENKICTENGQWIDIQVDTICVHGDGDHPTELVKLVFEAINS